MISQELRNLAEDITGKLAAVPDASVLVVDRRWLLTLKEIATDLAQDVAHIEAQPVPQHMRRACAPYRPALLVVGGTDA